MSHIPRNFPQIYAACIGARDPVEAGRLVDIIETAVRAGNASGAGWQDDIAKLRAIAGGGLAKRGDGDTHALLKSAFGRPQVMGVAPR